MTRENQASEQDDLWPSKIALQVDEVCNRFEQLLKEAASGQNPPPQLENFLHNVPEKYREDLFRELLVLEVEYRTRREEAPTKEEYLAWKESYPAILEEVFAPVADIATSAEQDPSVESASPAPPAIPQIPGYVIEEELGRGGMAVVFRAWQISLQRPVALKMIIPTGMSSDDEKRNRLIQEATAIAQLNHPNIVQVFEVQQHEGIPCFSMELIEGGSLKQWLQNHELSFAQMAGLLEVLAEAAHHAHQQGFIHRDLKPANVLLAPITPETTSAEPPDLTSFIPKLTDFGLVHNLDQELSETSFGAITGTVSYMAPEQAWGRTEQIQATTDVYGLGAILYEMLTGRPPFRAGTVMSTLLQVRFDQPIAPARLNPTVPRDLQTICLKSLHKNPKRRYETAHHLAEDLRRFQAHLPIEARPINPWERGWNWCRRNPQVSILTGLLLVLFAGLVITLFILQESQHRIDLARAKAQDAQRRTQLRDYVNTLGNIQEEIHRRSPGWTQRALRKIETAAITDLVERDRYQFHLRNHAAQCVTGVDLEEARILAEDFAAHTLAFHPQGRLLALGAWHPELWVRGRAFLVDVQTGAIDRELIFTPDVGWQLKQDKPDGLRAMTFSPDGRWLIGGGRSGKLHRWDLTKKDNTAESWIGTAKEIRRLVFSDNGQWLFSVPKQKPVQRWDVKTWKSTSPFPKQNDTHDIARFPQDQLVILTGKTLAIHEQATGKLLREVPAGGGLLAVHPQAQLIAVASRRVIEFFDPTSLRMTYALRAPGQVFSHPGKIKRILFSRGGSLLMSTSQETGHLRLWETGSGRLLMDIKVGAGAMRAEFDPTGRYLAVLGEKQTHLYEIHGQKVQTFLAQHPVSIIDFALASEADQFACLSGLFSPKDEQRANVWRLHPRGSQLIQQYAFDDNNFWQFAIQSDGKKLGWSGRRFLFQANPPDPPLRQVKLDERLHELAIDAQGQFWIAIRNELQIWKGEQKTTVWKNVLADRLTGKGQILALDAGTKHVLAGSRDGVARLFALNGELQHEVKINHGEIHSVALSPDETLAVVGTWEGSLTWWKLSDPSQVYHREEAHQETIHAIAFISSQQFVTGSQDQSLRFWNQKGSTLSETLMIPQNGPIQNLAATKDRTRLLYLIQHERALRCLHLDKMKSQLSILRLGIPGG